MNTETKEEYIEPNGFKGSPGEWKLILNKIVSNKQIYNIAGVYGTNKEIQYKANAILLSNSKELLKALQKAENLLHKITFHELIDKYESLYAECLEVRHELDVANSKALNIEQ